MKVFNLDELDGDNFTGITYEEKNNFFPSGKKDMVL